MRRKFIIPLLFIATLTIFSCSKDNDTKPDENESGTLITKMTQGLRPEDDTIFVFNYDADKRIKSIVDVDELDTFEAVYNTAGLVSAVVGKGTHSWGSTSFTYNTSNQLIQADFESSGGGYKTRYTFEYTGGVVSKQSYYTAMGGSQLALVSYTTYVVTNGNITSAKEYGSGNTLRGEMKYTYNNEPNVFQPICLFNWMNFLGANDVAGIEMFFNKNLITSETWIPSSGETSNAAFTYTYNDKKQLTKVVFTNPSYVSTRQFEY